MDDIARTDDAAGGRPKRKSGRLLQRSVALVGLMGAGKSSVGRRLAQAWHVRFRDSDVEIERAAAMRIPEIFDRYGEQHFREGERRVIGRLLQGPPHILATGGGAYMDPATRRDLARRAVTVWLKADLETLVDRCSRRGNRPLLKQNGVRPTLSRLIDERYPIYAEADIIVETGDAPHETAVADVIQALRSQGVLKDAPGREGDAAVDE